MTQTGAPGPIGQISRQVRDIGAAVTWYRDVLGLPHLFTFGTLAFFDCDGVRLYLQEGKKEVGGLSERGVKCLGAPHLIHRHESGLEEWMAFFEDPDGKVLALMSQVKPGT